MKWIDYKCSGKRRELPLISYVVLDTETTGLITSENEIIQLSMLKIEDGEIVDVFNNFYNSHNPIPERITALNGISDEMVKDKPYIEDCLKEISSFIGDLPILGHNVGFDVKFLEKYFMQKENRKLNNEWDDTMKLARENFQLSSYKLGDLSIRFNNKYFPSHNSLDDCYATYELYEAIKNSIIGK